MPICDSSETSGPSVWVTQNYIENALQTYLSDSTVKLKKFEIIPASAKGENYVSILFRIRVEYSRANLDEVESMNLILKSTLEDDNSDSEAMKMFQSYGVYRQEMRVYDEFMPIFKRLLQENSCDEELAPKTVKVDYEHESILLEDLAVRDYKMADVRQGLNEIHAKLILRKLARMHAVSAVVSARNQDIFKDCDRGIFTKHTFAAEPLFQANFDCVARMISKWEGYEEYAEKISKLIPRIMEYGTKVVEAKDHHFNVLNHGDMWCNNAMFRYNENGEPIDAILLDFQFSCWTSPTIDLHYFLNTSLVEELRLNRLEEFVQFYHENLAETLEILKFDGKIPTLHELWLQYEETAFYAFFTIMISQPLMIVEETDDASIECLLRDTEQSKRFRNAIYDNKTVQENFRKLLPVFDRRGLLDLPN